MDKLLSPGSNYMLEPYTVAKSVMAARHSLSIFLATWIHFFLHGTYLQPRQRKVNKTINTLHKIYA